MFGMGNYSAIHNDFNLFFGDQPTNNNPVGVEHIYTGTITNRTYSCTLTAEAWSGYRFVSWSISYDSNTPETPTTSPYNLDFTRATSDMTVTVLFERIPIATTGMGQSAAAAISIANTILNNNSASYISDQANTVDLHLGLLTAEIQTGATSSIALTNSIANSSIAGTIYPLSSADVNTYREANTLSQADLDTLATIGISLPTSLVISYPAVTQVTNEYNIPYILGTPTFFNFSKNTTAKFFLCTPDGNGAYTTRTGDYFHTNGSGTVSFYRALNSST
jgi:hypothetical protein